MGYPRRKGCKRFIVIPKNLPLSTAFNATAKQHRNLLVATDFVHLIEYSGTVQIMFSICNCEHKIKKVKATSIAVV